MFVQLLFIGFASGYYDDGGASNKYISLSSKRLRAHMDWFTRTG